MELRQWLVWLAGSGAGIVAQFLYAKWLSWRQSNNQPDLPGEWKAYIIMAVSGVIAVAAWGIQVLAGYEPVPVTGLAWVESIFQIASTAVFAYGGTQITYARTVLRSKRLNGNA